MKHWTSDEERDNKQKACHVLHLYRLYRIAALSKCDGFQMTHFLKGPAKEVQVPNNLPW